MIMRDTPPRMLSRTGFLALLALGVLLLPFWPTWAHTETPQASDPAAEQPPAAEKPENPSAFPPTRPLVVRGTSRTQLNENEQAKTRPANRATPNEDMESARDEVELAKAQLDIQRAQVAAAEGSLKMAIMQRDRIKKLSDKGAVSQEDVAQAENAAEAISLQLNIKRAELRAPEVRLRQAQRRMQFLSYAQMEIADRGLAEQAERGGLEEKQLLELSRSKRKREPWYAEYVAAQRRNNPPEAAAPRTSMRPPGADVEHLRDLDTKLDAVMAQLEALRLELKRMQRPRESDSPKK